MRNILTALDQYYPLTDSAKDLLIPKLDSFSMKKGSALIPELHVSPYIFFVEKGAIKNNYIDEKGNKNAAWFGFEGDISFSLSAYFNIPHFPECVELLEDSLLYRVKLEIFKPLLNENLEWSNWGRFFAEFHLIKLIQETDEYRALTAKEKYRNLIQSNSNIQHRVPLKDIASYLGVSPVTISRFRKVFKSQN